MSPKRFSRLALAEYCGASHTLGESLQHESRRALMGTAFHAVAEAGGDWTVPECAVLTAAELEEIRGYAMPQSSQHLPPVDSDKWRREHKMGLGPDMAIMPYESDECVSRGTCDMIYLHEDHPIVIVADIKLSTYTSDPLALQLSVPAIALTTAYELEAWRTALWIASEARWILSPIIWRGSREEASIIAQYERALATDPNVYTVGDHCAQCFSADKCPATLIAATADKALAPLEDGTITADNLGELWARLKTLDKVVKAGKTAVNSYIERCGTTPIGGGKELYMARRKGRESVSAKKLRAEYPDIADELCSRGHESRFVDARKERS